MMTISIILSLPTHEYFIYKYMYIRVYLDSFLRFSNHYLITFTYNSFIFIRVKHFIIIIDYFYFYCAMDILSVI